MDFLCPSNALPEGTSRTFSVGDLELFGVRRQGRAYLYRNRCPHRGIALQWSAEASLLEPGAQLIECAHHGALFLIDSGECVAGPCEGEMLESLGCHEDERGLWLTRPAAPESPDR
ncbi:Rieske (2Fe-2S) protein [Pseudomonas sp.]|uniref:Rieske (2Fe-2S) protein n=1 Tax=Pseudomonas sp. TaxID=306 RepID=UPI0028AB3DBD|nr:Rieske 2Fe-2S domain-containing protein [Pseudomonas sp.]